MKEKSFIVKMGGKYAFFLFGTEEELKAKLKSLGMTIVTRKKVHEEDLGKLYTIEIVTKISVLGYNKNVYNDICDRIREALDKNYPDLSDKFINSYNGNQLITEFSRKVPYFTSKVTILISSGKTERRRQMKVDELTSKLFWKAMGDAPLFYSNPSLLE